MKRQKITPPPKEKFAAEFCQNQHKKCKRSLLKYGPRVWQKKKKKSIKKGVGNFYASQHKVTLARKSLRKGHPNKI